MINQEVLNKEQIIRKVTSVGNGAHVFAPKEWIGDNVVIIRTPLPSLNERILNVLKPYLENILGVFLYGSYARGEQRQDSDIDILIISSKKFKIKEKGFEIIILERDEISKAIKIAPVLIYSSFMEAKPIINSKLFYDLRKDYKPVPEDFIKYIKETKNIIKINEELLDPYSIFLRLRGIYIIEKILSGKIPSYKGFKENVFESGKDDFDYVYDAYLRIKAGLKAEIKETDLKIFLQILKDRTKKLEDKFYGKKKKEA
jgi:predicted nucleotidyltransferase/putative transposon-encoded protein